VTRYLAGLSLVLFLLFPGGGLASESVALQDTVYRLPEILIEAERVSDLENLKNRPAFIAVIPIDNTSRQVSSAAEYLARAVGCHVQTAGGYGAYSTASVRGSSAKQVRVYIDGIPINQSQSGIIDLSDIPLAALERIEVYRGFGPYDLSGSSIGGVINLVTRGPDPERRGRISASVGSLSTLKLQGSYAFTQSGWDIFAVGAVTTTDGDFEFLDDNGTPYNTADDAVVDRINNNLDEYEGLIKATSKIGGGTFVASNQFLYRRQGLPGYSALQSRTERMTRTYDLIHLAWHRPLARAVPIQTAFGIYYLYRLDHFEDRRPKGPGVKPDEENRTISIGANLRWNLPLPRIRQTMRGMLEIGREAFQPRETFTETLSGERQSRLTFVATLEDEVSLAEDRIRLIPSGRYERYTDRTQTFEQVRRDMTTYNRDLKDTTITHTQGIGSMSLVLAPGSGVTIKANYGRYYRIPSLMETFGYRGMTVPNPGLEPETGLNRDIGLRWEAALIEKVRASLEYAYFWSDVDDLIMYVYVPFAQASQAINIDSAEIEGYECSIACGSWRGFSLSANLTYLHAINRGPIAYMNGKHLPNRPEIEAYGRVDWQQKGFSAFYEFDYVSGNYWNAYNGKAPNNKGPLFPIRRLHSLGFTLPAGLPRTGLTLEVRNIADEVYEDVMGYPLPGRSVYGTITYDM
jgi:outer membrane cobalamin receptor